MLDLNFDLLTFEDLARRLVLVNPETDPSPLALAAKRPAEASTTAFHVKLKIEMTISTFRLRQLERAKLSFGLHGALILSLVGIATRTSSPILAAHAIKHRRGFTLDVEIGTADIEKRRMRLIAAPVIANGRVVRLHGLKLAI